MWAIGESENLLCRLVSLQTEDAIDETVGFRRGPVAVAASQRTAASSAPGRLLDPGCCPSVMVGDEGAKPSGSHALA